MSVLLIYVLQVFVSGKKYFLLEHFNLHIHFFDYGYVQDKSKPVEIFSNSLLSGGQLKDSALAFFCLEFSSSLTYSCHHLLLVHAV